MRALGRERRDTGGEGWRGSLERNATSALEVVAEEIVGGVAGGVANRLRWGSSGTNTWRIVTDRAATTEVDVAAVAADLDDEVGGVGPLLAGLLSRRDGRRGGSEKESWLGQVRKSLARVEIVTLRTREKETQEGREGEGNREGKWKRAVVGAAAQASDRRHRTART